MQTITHNNFPGLYISLRKKENRLYADEQVRHLPDISKEHPHYREWLARKRSSDKLVRHLRNMKKPLSILEIGCGNGWLAHKLATVPGANVTGFDINLEELEQAARVFSGLPNLRFAYGDSFFIRPSEKLYDMVVFAASIQYFPSLEAIIKDVLQHLQPQGSIHIIDSHFYKAGELEAAKQRTATHFESLGFSAMSDHYFHHSMEALGQFNCQVLYNPNAPLNRLKRTTDPFPWICIKKELT
jgi:ubiquinone/menaquinone biosynthesis C-methylase UbiE